MCQHVMCEWILMKFSEHVDPEQRNIALNFLIFLFLEGL